MIQTETSKAKILFVEVPIDAECYDIISISPSEPLEFGVTLKDEKVITRTLPQGNWQILNTLKDVSEDEAEMVVENINDKRFIRYTDYTRRCKTATESIQSLAQSLNLDAQKNYVILFELK